MLPSAAAQKSQVCFKLSPHVAGQEGTQSTAVHARSVEPTHHSPVQLRVCLPLHWHFPQSPHRLSFEVGSVNRTCLTSRLNSTQLFVKKSVPSTLLSSLEFAVLSNKAFTYKPPVFGSWLTKFVTGSGGVLAGMSSAAGLAGRRNKTDSHLPASPNRRQI